MATVQEIIDAGFAKSSAARPETMTETPELLGMIAGLLQLAFQEVGRVNPYVFGTFGAIAFDGSGWPLPATCSRAIGLRARADTIANPALAVGAVVNIVPFDDPLMCEGAASVMPFGQRYLPTGQSMDPSAGSLTLYFSRIATAPATVNDAIDALFPAQFNEYLHYGVAEYLADKDERAADKERFGQQKMDVLARMVRWAEGQDYEIQQRHPSVTAPLTNTDGGRQQPTRGSGV